MTQPSERGSATDYSDPGNWLSLPEARHGVDTFYIYPTCYMDGSEGAAEVCPVDDPSMRAGARDKLIGQASAFEGSTNVFAPFYRQTNIYRIMSMTPEEAYAFQHGVQRDDVFAALDRYFGELNGGRPFILAGHSQGSIMQLIVLSEYMREHPDVYERMVAAYVIGYSVTSRYLSENPHLRFAEGADDTGVVVSWNAEGPENLSHDNFVVQEGAISINPLTWSRGGELAPASLNRGSRVKLGECEYRHVDGFGDARVDLERGSVICTTASEYYNPPHTACLFGPASLHAMDYNLYYDNIVENVARRVSAFTGSRSP